MSSIKDKIPNALFSKLFASLLKEAATYAKELKVALKEDSFNDRTLRSQHVQNAFDTVGISFSIENQEQMYADYPCIYVANHQSLLDAALMCIIFQRNVRFLAKSSVFAVPILGKVMEHEGHIKVYRGKHSSKNTSLKDQIAQAIKEGDSVLFFPEGTRSTDGVLQSFKLGAFFASVQNQVPIVPILVEGTANVLKKHSVRLQPNHCNLRFLTPTYPEDNSSLSEREQAEALSDAVTQTFRDAMRKENS